MKTHWSPQFDGRDFSIETDELICNSFYQMREVTVKHKRFQGGEISITRDLFWRPDAVCVLLYDALEDCVVLIEQFRIGTLDHPRSPWQLELVAGLVEPGETPEDVAHRECQEEAGAEVLALESICRFTPSPGGVREYVDLFCARVDSRVISGVHGLEEEGEDIKVHRFSAEAACNMVSTGEMDNAVGIIALQWLQMHRPRLQELWGEA